MSFQFFPWYTGDYIRDTRHLTPMRHGVYLLLLAHCWDQKGPVPLDEQESAGIANCRSADEIEALRYILTRYFVRMDDGWYNQRMTEEIAKAEAISEGRRKGGFEKARRQRDALRHAQALLKQSTSNASAGTPTPTPTPIKDLNHVPFGPTGLRECASNVDAPVADPVDKSETYSVPPCPTAEIVKRYHDRLPMLPAVEVLSEQRKRHIAARWRQVCADEKLDRQAGIDWFDDFFAHVAKSDFLTGKTKPKEGRRPFAASLDWLMGAEKFVLVYEGKYHR
jgi:uncharacterized protein YdaU (DUF1376 family)